MPGDDTIASLIPHQGSMCLLEHIVTWDADRVVLTTRTHQQASNPLRLDGRLRAVHLCEYGAQAMAVHGGLLARAEGRAARPGFLVSLRDVTFEVDFLDALDGELEVTAHRLLESETSWQYEFEVKHRGERIAAGRAAVMARA